MEKEISSLTKIRHLNDLNKTLATMPLAARRVLFMAISDIKDTKRAIGDREFRVYASEYAKIAKVDRSVAYKQLKDASINLQKQLIGIPKDQLLPPIPRIGEKPWERPSGKGVRMLNITSYCDYEEGDGYVDIVFSRHMEPYICRLEKNFTTQVLISSARLRDVNASTFYQLIRERKSQGFSKYFDISIEELKDYLNLYTEPKKGERVYSYPEFKIFNRDVLKRAKSLIEDITEIKKLNIEISERRKRKAHKLRISYEVDEQMKFEGF